MTLFIAPGATLGVVGGGQLGRMFVHAAQRLGYRAAVLDPDPESPAGRVAHAHVRADYLNPNGLDRLASMAAAITTEFENVPADALRRLAMRRPVAPGADAVAACQDRLVEKAAFVRAGLACAPHAAIRADADVAAADRALFPGILKTTQLGYDGKGQVRVAARADLDAAWTRLARRPAVLEQRLDLSEEISVVVARGADGTVVALPVQQNVHRAGILALTRVPARGVDTGQQAAAVEAARRLAASLGYVGVLCVEFFLLADGALVVNEMAPRPHNSGHYSIDGCDVSQFELQVRALVGAPLVAPRLHSPSVMLNLLGELWGAAGTEPDWARVLALPGAHLHLYGKAAARPGRKMGHLTLTAADAETAEATAREAAARLGIEGW